jgi:hypothetical protein
MTMLHVIKPDGTFTSEDYVGELVSGTPAWAHLRKLIGLKENDLVEHVSVLWKGEQAHMLVDEEGIRHNLTPNVRATRIYYNNMLNRAELTKPLVYNDLNVDPTLSVSEWQTFYQPGYQIVGNAVLWEGDME